MYLQVATLLRPLFIKSAASEAKPLTVHPSPQDALYDKFREEWIFFPEDIPEPLSN